MMIAQPSTNILTRSVITIERRVAQTSFVDAYEGSRFKGWLRVGASPHQGIGLIADMPNHSMSAPPAGGAARKERLFHGEANYLPKSKLRLQRRSKGGGEGLDGNWVSAVSVLPSSRNSLLHVQEWLSLLLPEVRHADRARCLNEQGSLAGADLAFQVCALKAQWTEMNSQNEFVVAREPPARGPGPFAR